MSTSLIFSSSYDYFKQIFSVLKIHFSIKICRRPGRRHDAKRQQPSVTYVVISIFMTWCYATTLQRRHMIKRSYFLAVLKLNEHFHFSPIFCIFSIFIFFFYKYSICNLKGSGGNNNAH